MTRHGHRGYPWTHIRWLIFSESCGSGVAIPVASRVSRAWVASVSQAVHGSAQATRSIVWTVLRFLPFRDEDESLGYLWMCPAFGPMPPLFMGQPLPTNDSGKLGLDSGTAALEFYLGGAWEEDETEREGGKESEGKSERKEGSRLGRLRGSERASERASARAGAGVRASAVSKRRAAVAAPPTSARCDAKATCASERWYSDFSRIFVGAVRY